MQGTRKPQVAHTAPDPSQIAGALARRVQWAVREEPELDDPALQGLAALLTSTRSQMPSNPKIRRQNPTPEFTTRAEVLQMIDEKLEPVFRRFDRLDAAMGLPPLND